MNEWSTEEDNLESKSSRKREMHELQRLAEQLAAAKPNLWQELNLGANLHKALDDCQKITAREAKRRHMQYLGKLIRAEDIEQIRALLEAQSSSSLDHQRQFAEVEHWRAKLLTEPSSLTEFVNHYQCTDLQSLRQALKNTPIKEGQPELNSQASKKLFKLLKAIILN